MKTICNSNFSVHNKVLLEHEKKKKTKISYASWSYTLFIKYT